MLNIIDFWLFFFSVLLLSVIPGPDMAYVIGQSVTNGRRAGILSASGVALGSLTHAILSAFGLTAIITTSPIMFAVVKYIGATYLIYLGGIILLDALKSKREKKYHDFQLVKKSSAYTLLSKGFITTLTNPKVLLFFISFFPQFVTSKGGQYTASFLLLGIIYVIITFIMDVTLSIMVGSVAGAVSENRKLKNSLGLIVGFTFIVLGLSLILTRR